MWSFSNAEISHELMAKGTGSLAQLCSPVSREELFVITQTSDCAFQVILQEEIPVAGRLRQKHAAALFAEAPVPKALAN
jgi:hypothetical protein